MADCGFDLERYLVQETPPTVYYIPDFVSEEEADYLWKQVYLAPQPKWTQLSHRRLQNWGGLPHPKGMVQEALPRWLEDCCQKVSQLGMFGDKVPNHVLVNEYTPGQGIMPHEDGPLYHPVVTTISLGSHTLLDFYTPLNDTQEKDEKNHSDNTRILFSLLLEPRSLLILKDDMYTKLLHGISERNADLISHTIPNISSCKAVSDVGRTLERGTRVSLTIRYVPKTLKLKLKFGK